MNGRQNEAWRWYCMACLQDTERAPCEHCGADHDSIAVLEPGAAPPATEAECDEAATIEDFDWPEEAYV